MTRPLVVVGDALLDVDWAGTTTRLAPDAPVPVVEEVVERERPGGAALAAYLAARDASAATAGGAGSGREVVLLAPMAQDGAAARLRRLLAPHVRVVALPWGGRTAVKTRIRAGGQSLVRVDTGGDAGPVGDLPEQAHDLLADAGAVLVSDYGRGAAAADSVRTALAALPPRVPVVWDPHPRGAVPVPGARLVTPNRAEAAGFAASLGISPGAGDGRELAHTCGQGDALVAAWRAGAVAVTLGAQGAVLCFGKGTPLVVPAPPVSGGDPCGAGDRFAATAAGLLAAGALGSEAVQGAVLAASQFVAAGGAAGLAAAPARAPVRTGAEGTSAPPTPPSVAAVLTRVRASGGTVVATGGCFDLLHAGHVATLRAARALGDCLVVCINSDASVRRLKGPQRPLQAQQDRVRVLEALECVDAVVVFDEDTPEAVLDRLRPQVWVKGGDYAGVDLPESRLVASWGGSAVVLPYLDGRSTTGLVHAARGSTCQSPNRTDSEEMT